MKYAVIDIGSNTMRIVIYDVIEGKFSVVLNERSFAELLSYIEDDALSDEGIHRLCSILKNMKILSKETNCEEVFCFATASLRYIENQKAVVDAVKRETGINIRLLSGCEESFYDFVALKAAIQEDEALGFDLGGGSGQIIYYKDNKLIKSFSERIGTLDIYNKHVKGLFPNSKERGKIIKQVNKKMSSCGDFQVCDNKRIYGMGGTARALARVHRHLVGSDERIANYKMTIEDIEEVDSTLTGLGLSGIKLLSRILPERLITFMPGLLTIKEIMRYTNTTDLTVINYGVREGYLIDQAVNKGRGFDEFRNSQCDIYQ